MISKLKKIAQSSANLLGYRIISASDISDKIIRDEFGEIYKKCRNYTATSIDRMYALYKAVEYIVRSKIPGDFVECGVWKGGSVMAIAYALLRMKDTKRKIYLYDTFEGMPEPTKEDRRISDGTSVTGKWKQKQGEGRNKWFFASLPEAKKNVFSTGYPKKNMIFVRGKVEETIPKHAPSKIALLRLDTDWYESTKHELIHLYPRLSKRGVLIIDDYGHFAGSKKAVDEYFARLPMLLNRIDSAGRIGIKL